MKFAARMLAGGLVLAALPASASAATFCVSDPGCPAGGVEEPSAEAALHAASASEAADVVRLGPGGFALGAMPSVAPNDVLRGAGSPATTATTSDPLALQGGLQDLALKAPGTAVSASGSPAALARVLIAANRGIVTSAGSVTATDVAIALSGTNPVGVDVTDASADLSHLTIAGAAGTGAAVHASCDLQASASLTLSESAIAGLTVHLLRDGPDAIECIYADGADLNVNESIFAPAKVQQQGKGSFNGGSPVAEDAQLIDAAGGDLRPRYGSPALDAISNQPVRLADSTTDVRGLPRPVDADADGHAYGDIGAYEYQRAAPVAVPTADPVFGPPGTPFAFGAGKTSDLDGDALSYAWSFDDGTTAEGAAVSHSFAGEGKHKATLTVTDVTGLSASGPVEVGDPLPPARSGTGTTEIQTAQQPLPPDPFKVALVPVTPRSVGLRVSKRPKRRYRLTATVVLPADVPKSRCTGDEILFRERVANLLANTRRARLDRSCRARITLRLLRGVPARLVTVKAEVPAGLSLNAASSRSRKLH